MAAKLEKKELVFDTIDQPETWQGGKKISIVSYLLRKKDNKKGMSFKIGSKNESTGKALYGKTIWIDEDLDLPSWLKWFIETIKKGYVKLFGKKFIGIDGQSEYYKAKVEELTKALTESQLKLEEAQKNEQSYQQKIEYAKKVKDSFTEYKTIFNGFEKLILESKNNDRGKEEEIKKKIKAHHWLLGLECSVEAKNQDIDIQLEIDLHVKTKYNQDRIFELKSPNLSLFEKKGEGKNRRLTLTKEISDGLAELILYLRKTDLYSDSHSKGTYGIQKASGVILAGYNLEEEHLELLKNVNFHVYPHICIVTYNDLLQNISEELEIIASLDPDNNTKNKEK